MVRPVRPFEGGSPAGARGRWQPPEAATHAVAGAASESGPQDPSSAAMVCEAPPPEELHMVTHAAPESASEPELPHPDTVAAARDALPLVGGLPAAGQLSTGTHAAPEVASELGTADAGGDPHRPSRRQRRRQRPVATSTRCPWATRILEGGLGNFRLPPRRKRGFRVRSEPAKGAARTPPQLIRTKNPTSCPYVRWLEKRRRRRRRSAAVNRAVRAHSTGRKRSRRRGAGKRGVGWWEGELRRSEREGRVRFPLGPPDPESTWPSDGKLRRVSRVRAEHMSFKQLKNFVRNAGLSEGPCERHAAPRPRRVPRCAMGAGDEPTDPPPRRTPRLMFGPKQSAASKGERGKKRSTEARSRSPRTLALMNAFRDVATGSILMVMNAVGQEDACAKHAEGRGCTRGRECKRAHVGAAGSELARAAVAVNAFRTAKHGTCISTKELLRLLERVDPSTSAGWYHPVQGPAGAGAPAECALAPSIYDAEAPASEIGAVVRFFQWVGTAKHTWQMAWKALMKQHEQLLARWLVAVNDAFRVRRAVDDPIVPCCDLHCPEVAPLSRMLTHELMHHRKDAAAARMRRGIADVGPTSVGGVTCWYGAALVVAHETLAELCKHAHLTGAAELGDAVNFPSLENTLASARRLGFAHVVNRSQPQGGDPVIAFAKLMRSTPEVVGPFVITECPECGNTEYHPALQEAADEPCFQYLVPECFGTRPVPLSKKLASDYLAKLDRNPEVAHSLSPSCLVMVEARDGDSEDAEAVEADDVEAQHGPPPFKDPDEAPDMTECMTHLVRTAGNVLPVIAFETPAGVHPQMLKPTVRIGHLDYKPIALIATTSHCHVVAALPPAAATPAIAAGNTDRQWTFIDDGHRYFDPFPDTLAERCVLVVYARIFEEANAVDEDDAEAAVLQPVKLSRPQRRFGEYTGHIDPADLPSAGPQRRPRIMMGDTPDPDRRPRASWILVPVLAAAVAARPHAAYAPLAVAALGPKAFAAAAAAARSALHARSFPLSSASFTPDGYLDAASQEAAWTAVQEYTSGFAALATAVGRVDAAGMRGQQRFAAGVAPLPRPPAAGDSFVLANGVDHLFVANVDPSGWYLDAVDANTSASEPYRSIPVLAAFAPPPQPPEAGADPPNFRAASGAPFFTARLNPGAAGVLFDLQVPALANIVLDAGPRLFALGVEVTPRTQQSTLLPITSYFRTDDGDVGSVTTRITYRVLRQILRDPRPTPELRGAALDDRYPRPSAPAPGGAGAAERAETVAVDSDDDRPHQASRDSDDDLLILSSPPPPPREVAARICTTAPRGSAVRQATLRRALPCTCSNTTREPNARGRHDLACMRTTGSAARVQWEAALASEGEEAAARVVADTAPPAGATPPAGGLGTAAPDLTRPAAPLRPGAAPAEPPPPPVPPHVELPSLEVIVATPARVLQWVPRGARPAWDRTLARVLERISASADADRFKRYFALARVVLAKPARKDGDPARIVVERCRRFLANDFRDAGAMWFELYPGRAEADAPPEQRAAQPSAAAAAPPTTAAAAPPRTAVRAEMPATCGPGAPLQWDDVVDEDAVDSKLMKRALFHAHAAEYSKAMAAFGTAEAAAKTEENAALLAALHPADAVPPLRDPPASAAPPPISKRKVRGCLRSFKLASSGGLSLLTPQHLKDACSAQGAFTYDALTSAVGIIMGGLIPAHAQPYLCGARLVGLVKKDRSLRPVAAGDVLRRMAGRLLSRAVSPEARRYFLEQTQVGVAVEGGADAAIAACRDTARTLPEGHVIVKIDQRNAFNSALRAPMLDEIAAKFPALYPYARMAYGAASWLFFGPHKIVSRRGVQQGCPLGPLFFSLVMAAARRAARARLTEADLAAITFEAWFLDDGTVAGDAGAVGRYIAELEAACRAFGLDFNRGKCEVIARPGDAIPECFNDFRRFDTTKFELLGVPCGDDASVVERCDELAAAIQKRLKLLGHLSDPQVVYALLRYCGGFPLANFMARAAGPLGAAAFRDIDAATLRAFETGVSSLNEGLAREAIRLPPRHGGLALRSVEDSAPLAFVGAWVAAKALRRHLVSADNAARIDAAGDPRLRAALDAPQVTSSPAVAEHATDIATRALSESESRKQQRELQQKRDTHVAEQLRARAPRSFVARLMSASAAHASSWLCPAPGTEDPMWIEAGIFVSLIRFRYGQKLQPVPSDCVLCGVAKACDVYGMHTTLCAGSGAKWYIHNQLRDVTFSIAADALMSPSLEPVELFATLTGARPDILMSLGPDVHRTFLCLDVTVANPLRVDLVCAAAAAPGGAAEKAQQAKHLKYGAHAARAGFPFLGVAFDVLGAPSSDARTLFRHLGRAWGRRHDLGPSRAIPIVAGAIVSTLVRAVGRLLLRNSAPNATARDFVNLATLGSEAVSARALGRIPANRGEPALAPLPARAPTPPPEPSTPPSQATPRQAPTPADTVPSPLLSVGGPAVVISSPPLPGSPQPAAAEARAPIADSAVARADAATRARSDEPASSADSDADLFGRDDDDAPLPPAAVAAAGAARDEADSFSLGALLNMTSTSASAVTGVGRSLNVAVDGALPHGPVRPAAREPADRVQPTTAAACRAEARELLHAPRHVLNRTDVQLDDAAPGLVRSLGAATMAPPIRDQHPPHTSDPCTFLIVSGTGAPHGPPAASSTFPVGGARGGGGRAQPRSGGGGQQLNAQLDALAAAVADVSPRQADVARGAAPAPTPTTADGRSTHAAPPAVGAPRDHRTAHDDPHAPLGLSAHPQPPPPPLLPPPSRASPNEAATPGAAAASSSSSGGAADRQHSNVVARNSGERRTFFVTRAAAAVRTATAAVSVTLGLRSGQSQAPPAPPLARASPQSPESCSNTQPSASGAEESTSRAAVVVAATVATAAVAAPPAAATAAPAASPSSTSSGGDLVGSSSALPAARAPFGGV
jgi:hypothetical protein